MPALNRLGLILVLPVTGMTYPKIQLRLTLDSKGGRLALTDANLLLGRLVPRLLAVVTLAVKDLSDPLTASRDALVRMKTSR
jgi:hypothetical protein